MKNINYFLEKQKKIVSAIRRVEKLLKNYELNPPKGDIWNLTHDLMYRMESRYNELLSEYHDWHWDNFGFNAYTIR